MAELTDNSRTRAQLELWRDILWSMGERGDPYARVLRAKEDPYPHYEEIRKRGALWQSAMGTWVTPNYKLANKVLRDKRFGVLHTDGGRPTEFMEFDNSLLGMDPPDHTRLRKLTIPTLNPRLVGKWRPRAEEICHELVDQVLAIPGEFNFMTEFAHQLPIALIGDLVGIPGNYRKDFFRLSRHMTPLIEGVASFEGAMAVNKAVKEMTGVFVDIIALRSADPRDDMISNLLPAVEDGTLTMDEMIPLCMFLPLAGTETTVNLIGNGLRALLDHPEQWQLVKENPEMATGVVQETLRYDSPVQQYRRVAHQDIELEGQIVPADGELVVIAAAANRDPEIYPDPAVFDITRTGGPETLAFSAGIHYCLGAPLARLEAEVAFQTIATRLPEIRRAGPVRHIESFIIRGMTEFPVAVR